MANDFEILDIEKEDDFADEVLVEYDIASYPSDYTISVLVQMWKDEDITIPDFQRSFVWTIKQSTLLIESFLIGLPIPPIFLYIDDENKNLVVDGQQRLMSIIYFIEGFFGPENEKGKRQIFRLTGLNKESKFHDKKFSELDLADQRKLQNSVLRAINIRQLSPKQENTSIYHIFERLNTGGTPLTPQEIRNVVFRGSFYSKLKDLNKFASWRKVIGKKSPDKHQKDIELILRIFALSNYLTEYEKPMREFLNIISGRYKNSETKVILNFISNFRNASNIILEAFGEKPFHIRGPLNTSAFDSIFCAIINNLELLPKDLTSRYRNLLGDEQFKIYTSIGTTDSNTLNARFKYVEQKLIK
jgi:uncharacterized protein with ParB-like and HNH nuclease domain